VYIANNTTSNLAAFSIGSGGTLTSVIGEPYGLGFTPGSIAFTPSGNYMYVGGVNGQILLYAVASTGELTVQNNGQSIVAGASPVSMAVDPTGAWLLVLSNDLTTITTFPLNSDGTAGTGMNTTFSTGVAGAAAVQLVIAPNDQTVFATLGTGGLLAFTFDSGSGTLTYVSTTNTATPGGASFRGMSIDKNSAYLYVAMSGLGLGVFNIGSGATITPVAHSPYAAGLGPYGVLVDATNSYVYMSNATDGTISGWSIAAGGQLTPLSGSPYQSGYITQYLAEDLTHTYILAINNGGTPDLRVFSFSGGPLVSVETASTGNDPTGPAAIAVAP
jgi:6-phosphogluconolactonase (cycloisomerase 2 family)